VLVERGDAAAACTILDNLAPDFRKNRELAFGMAVSHERMAKDKRTQWEILAHSSPLTALKLSREGKYAISGCDAGKIRYWNCEAPGVLHVLEGHRGAVKALVFRRAETIALSAGADGTIRYWDLALGTCPRVLESDGPVCSLDLCDDARVLISGGEDGSIRYWDLSSGALVNQWSTQDSAVLSVAVSSNGAYAISGHESGNLSVWDIRDGRLLKRFTQNKAPVTGMAVSHTRPYVVTTSGRLVRVWNLGRGEIIRTLRGHKTEVDAVCLDQTNRHILSASAHGTLKLWDLKSGQCIRSLSGTAPVALSDNGRFCVTGDESGMLKYWHIHLDEAPLVAPFMICRDFMRRSEIPEVEL